jgi:hypothetical protein
MSTMWKVCKSWIVAEQIWARESYHILGPRGNVQESTI